MARAVRVHDWAKTPLGPAASWPASLKFAVELILASGASMVVRWGPDLIQIYNDAYREFLGGKHPALGRPARECWPEVWSDIEPILHRVMNGETLSFQNKHFVITRGGCTEDVWFTVSYSPIRNERGEPGGVLATSFETTAQVKAEVALRASEARFRNIYSYALGSIAILDWDGRFLQCNPAFCSLLGYAEAEITGKNFASLVHPAERERNADLARHLRNGEMPYFEVEGRYLRKDGQPVWVRKNVSMFPGEAGEPPRFLVVAVDIGETKRSELALREAEERLRFALDAAGAGIWESLPGSGGFTASERALALHGLAPGTPLTYENTLSTLHPDDRPRFAQALRHTVEMGERFSLEWRVPQPDGSVRWIDSQAELHAAEGKKRLVGVVRDITEAKRAAEELRLTTERFELAIKGSPIVVSCQDLDLRYTWIYNPSPSFRTAQIIGKRDGDIYERAEDAEITEAIKREVIQTGKSHRSEVVIRFEGVDRHFDLLADPMMDDGKICGVRCAAIDITDRKQAEEKIRESEALLKAATDNASVGLVLLDKDRRYRFVNRSYARILALGEEDLVGKGPAKVLASIYEDQISPHLDRAFAGNRVTYELVKPAPPGDPNYYSVIYEPLRNGQGEVSNVIVVIFDITAVKRAQLHVAASEARFRGIYEYAATGISIFDLEGRFQSGNPAYFAMLGYAEDDIRGKGFWDFVHPDDRETNLAHFRQVIAQQKPSFEIVNRYVGKHGEPIWVHKHVSLVRDAEGEPVNVIALVTDMTERKLHEEQVELLMREVNHRSKNLLAVVQAIASRTLATSPQDFIGRFGERVQALSANQDLLVKNDWKGASLDELILTQLAHFADLIGTRIELAGPSCVVSANAAQTLGMALHELATNAGKYGALSNKAGRVRVRWDIEQAGSEGASFTMSWTEHGGPPAVPPVHVGFGSTVIGSMAEGNLCAKVEMAYAAPGFSWELRCPAREVLEAHCFDTAGLQ